MPKRGAIALLLTTGALAFLLSFRTPDTATLGRPGRVAIASPVAGGNGGSVGLGGNGSTSATPRPRPTATASAVGGGTGGDSGRTGGVGGGTGGAEPAATPRATGGTAALRDGTYTGDSIQIRWGNVQVQVAISGGRIAAVTSLDMPYSDRRTQRITDVVEPMLREQALAIQGADLDTISGATYTSRAYAQSLQSALDKAAGG